MLEQMKDHVKQFETLSAPLQVAENPRVHELNVKIEQTNEEINKLLDKVSSANDVLMDYINRRVKELDTQITTYRQEIKELSPIQNAQNCDIEQIKDYMDKWDLLEYDDKRAVVDQLITVVKATEDSCEITWKI